MDKYEFKLKVDEMKALVSARNYNAAAEIAETINWRKIRNLNALVLAGEIFEQVERYEESKEILLMAYDKSPIGRNIIYRLAEIAIKTKNFVEAKEYYDEFVDIAPHDNLKFVLKYKMTAAQGLSYQEQIKILEELKEQEYSEEWAYELAYLYHRDGQPDKCVEACDELILWFGDGIYVEKALELKMQYQPLTKTQEEKYRLFRQKRTGVIEVKPEDFLESGEIVNETVQIPSIISSPEKYNTANLQNEIARGMQQIITAKEKRDVSNAMDHIKKAVETIPYMPEPEPKLESESEPEQTAAQMTIEEILADWEKTKQATQEALRRADGHKLESAKEKALQDAESLMDRLLEVIPQLTGAAASKGMTEREDSQEAGTTQRNAGQVQDNIEEASRIVAGMNKILQEQIDALTAKQKPKPRKIADPTRELPEIPPETAAEDPGLKVDMKKLEEQLTKAVEPEIQPELEMQQNEKIQEEAEVQQNTEEYEDTEIQEDIEVQEDKIVQEDVKIQQNAEETIVEPEQDESNEEAKEESLLEQESGFQREFSLEPEEEDDQVILKGRLKVQMRTPLSEMKEAESEKKAAEYEEASEYEEAAEYEEAVEYEKDKQIQETGQAEEIEKTEKIEEPEEEIIEEIPEEKIPEEAEPVHITPAPTVYETIPERVVSEKQLTAEQKERFSYFMPIEGMEAQIYDLLQGVSRHFRMDKNSKSGNIIIEGITGSGKTGLIKNIIKVLQNELDRPNHKIGKIDANALNQKNLDVLTEKVSGGCLIIESAGRISRETAVNLSRSMEKDYSGTIYILEDTPEGIQKAMERDSSFAAKFTEKISIPLLTNDELVAAGRIYANEQDYDIDEMGILALYKRIGNIQKTDHVTTLAEVKEIVDVAIDNAERGAFKKVIGILTSTRYSDRNRVILREKDFEE